MSFEERIIGGETWVAIRSRGAEWSLFTTDEAAKLGAKLVAKFAPVTECTINIVVNCKDALEFLQMLRRGVWERETRNWV